MMKSNKNLLIIFLILIMTISACTPNTESVEDTSEKGGLLSIKKPSLDNEIYGKWKLMAAHNLGQNTNSNQASENSEDSSQSKDEIFIAKSIFEYKGVKIIDPIVSARFINIQNYLKSKSLTVPDTLKLNNENIVVYKFQDGKTISQDIIELKNGRLLIFQKDQVEVFEKYNSVKAEEEQSRYKVLKDAIEGTDKNSGMMEYALSLGVRKNNYTKTGDTFDYSYSTYFIVKEKENSLPRVLNVKDIVFSKDNILRTVSHQRSFTDQSKTITSDKISFNPTFTDEKSKVNFIDESISRRIDYVNDNYISFTNKNQLANDNFEYYEIHNLNQLAKNKPLKVNNIGGPEALDSFNNAYTDTLYNVANQSDAIINYAIDESNIGIVRNRMSWGFITNFQANIGKEGRTVYRSIPLQIIPILDIASFDTKNIAWRDVLNRVPFATNAIVAPDGKSIIIQARNQISLFSIYNNFISLNPQLTIVNVTGVEIVMSKWYPSDSIKTVYEDYLKLPKNNTQLVFQ